MKKITNPILKGFNPDPSMIRVGEDYYIANSTFEWFPGVRIHHSTDLQNWELLNYALTRKEQLDMLGNPDSCGVWAPCLSYHAGIYYLVYSNVRSFDGGWKDTPNFLVTCTDIKAGNWSDPIYLNSMGFDASLFHDDDGRKWFVSLIVDHRKGKFFGGIVLQEYDVESQKLVGPIKNIFQGSELGITEGPHIYKRNGYYYLMTAEGGTEYNHAVSLARSRNIEGPYEMHPSNPVITAKHAPSNTLQKAGHASLVESPNGDSFCAFLVSRPLTEHGRCPLGRETALAQVEWKEDDWLYTVSGHKEPDDVFEITGRASQEKGRFLIFDNFDFPILNPEYNALRRPISEDWCSLNDRPGYLRLYGGESLSSFHHQSLLARRVEDLKFEVRTKVDFDSESFQQMAGLVLYYNTQHYHYLHISYHEDVPGKMIQIITCDKGNNIESPLLPLPIAEDRPLYLEAKVNHDKAQFSYSYDGQTWLDVGGELDFSILSDDYVCNDMGRYRAAFTGAFVGVCCQDFRGTQMPADFHFFEYKPL